MTTPTQDTILILETLYYQLYYGSKPIPVDLIDRIHNRLQELRKVKEAPKADQRSWPSGQYPYEPTSGPIDLALPLLTTEPEPCCNNLEHQMREAMTPDPLTGISPMQQGLSKTVIGGHDPLTKPSMCLCGETSVEIYNGQMDHIVKCLGCQIQTVSRRTKLDAIETWNHHCRRIKERMK